MKGADDAFEVDGFGGAVDRAFGEEMGAVALGCGLGLFFIEPPKPTAGRRIPVVGYKDRRWAVGIEQEFVVVEAHADAVGRAFESAFFHGEIDETLGVCVALPQGFPCAFCGFLVAAFEGDFGPCERSGGFERGDGKDDLLAFFDGGQREVCHLDRHVAALFGAIKGAKADEEVIGKMRIGLSVLEWGKRRRKVGGKIEAKVMAFAFGISEQRDDLRKAGSAKLSDIGLEAFGHLIACKVSGRLGAFTRRGGFLIFVQQQSALGEGPKAAIARRDGVDAHIDARDVAAVEGHHLRPKAFKKSLSTLPSEEWSFFAEEEVDVLLAFVLEGLSSVVLEGESLGSECDLIEGAAAVLSFEDKAVAFDDRVDVGDGGAQANHAAQESGVVFAEVARKDQGGVACAAPAIEGIFLGVACASPCDVDVVFVAEEFLQEERRAGTERAAPYGDRGVVVGGRQGKLEGDGDLGGFGQRFVEQDPVAPLAFVAGGFFELELVGGEYALLAGTIDPGEGREVDLEGLLEGAQGEFLIEGKIEALDGPDLGAAISGNDLVGLWKQGAQIDATARLMVFSVACCDLCNDGSIDTAEGLPCFDRSKDEGTRIVPTVDTGRRRNDL